MRFFRVLIAFIVLNFGALGLGALFMGKGAQSAWYLELEKAPWTPDGWVFGAAWTLLMICFSVYMAFLYLKRPTNTVFILFMMQFILNISWNLLFFNQKLIDFALVNILLLTAMVAGFFISYLKDLKGKSILILPYFIWLCIATSLNLYIALYN